MTDTDLRHQIIQSLRAGPKSFSELWTELNGTHAAAALADALTALLDGRKIVFMVAVGLYALGPEA